MLNLKTQNKRKIKHEINMSNESSNKMALKILRDGEPEK